MEARVLRSAQEIPGVVQLYECTSRKPDEVAFVMEYIHGLDLFDYIKHRKFLQEDEARNIFTQVLSIVRECHNRRIVHRDIKDENIILESNGGRVRLIDFGCSSFFNETTRFTDFQGTLDYAPPEWILNGEYGAESSTVWQLGTLLYSMVNGFPPFASKHDIISSPLVWITRLSADARDLIAHCLHRDPKLRYSISQIVTDRWIAQVDGATSVGQHL
jgi:serine/threonine protein kinase